MLEIFFLSSSFFDDANDIFNKKNRKNYVFASPIYPITIFIYKIKYIPQNQISWIRRRDWHILSSGAQLYTNDERFAILHAPGSNTWTLQIKFVQRRDHGMYECQVCVFIEYL